MLATHRDADDCQPQRPGALREHIVVRSASHWYGVVWGWESLYTPKRVATIRRDVVMIIKCECAERYTLKASYILERAARLRQGFGNRLYMGCVCSRVV